MAADGQAIEQAPAIRWEHGEDGVVVLTLSDPDSSVNTMNEAYSASMDIVLDRLELLGDDLVGVIIASDKKTFFAGGDLRELVAVAPEDAGEFAKKVRRTKAQLRRLESLGKPVVAALAGSALGGGLEIALAAHHRVALDEPRIKLGFPEVTLGLLPGAGGVVRSVRMLGIEQALNALLLEGRAIDPARASELGIVDELVGDREDLFERAKAWIQANPEAAQPWDLPGHRIPGGTPADFDFVPTAQALPARLRERLRGANYPAPAYIEAVAVEGSQVDFDNALEIEGRYFLALATGQVAKNMIGALFFDMQSVRADRGLVDGPRPDAPRRVAVLGAGMMGAGIAYVCAAAGLEVDLVDQSREAAVRGRGYSERLLKKAVTRERMTHAAADELLARIRPTGDPADAGGADVMIEAVFEDPEIKTAAYRALEPHLAPDALLGTNTSTLPIGGLAEGVSRPADFIGLHFFSPVDKMALLEIVVGPETRPEAVQRGLDLAKLIGKTPIVVRDSRGFFTSRVIGKFIDEGIAMLADGIPASSIEQAALQAGYPTGPLQLADELNLNLVRQIREEGRRGAEAEGRAWTEHPADPVLDRIVDEFGRGGRLAGKGFYSYADGKRDGLWPGLADAFGPAPADPVPLAELMDRMLCAEAREAILCWQEGVIGTTAEANVGSIIGIGFPRWTGGAMRFVDSFEGGPSGYLDRLRELTDRYGERFAPPQGLLDVVDRKGRFEDWA